MLSLCGTRVLSNCFPATLHARLCQVLHTSLLQCHCAGQAEGAAQKDRPNLAIDTSKMRTQDVLLLGTADPEE